MRYWPTSVIMYNLSLHPLAVSELAVAGPGKPLSHRAMASCCDVASRTPASETNLFLIETPGCGFRRIYLDYPDFEDWLRLERGGFVDTEITGFGYVLDVLH